MYRVKVNQVLSMMENNIPQIEKEKNNFHFLLILFSRILNWRLCNVIMWKMCCERARESIVLWWCLRKMNESRINIYHTLIIIRLALFLTSTICIAIFYRVCHFPYKQAFTSQVIFYWFFSSVQQCMYMFEDVLPILSYYSTKCVEIEKNNLTIKLDFEY